MEALKKAELAKQAGQSAAGGDNRLRLEPVDANTEAPPASDARSGNSLPDLPPQLEILDAEFMAHAEADKAAAQKAAAARAPAPQPPPAPSSPAAGIAPTTARLSPRSAAPAAGTDTNTNARLAAQQVFSAKQPERSRTVFHVTLGVVALLAASAIGGYFWWQLQPKSSLAVRPPLAGNAAPPVPVQAPVQAPVPPPVAVAPVVAQVAEPASSAAGKTPVAAKADPDDDNDRPRRQTVATRPFEADAPVRISKSRLKVNPGAALGYEAMSKGDLATAKAEYLRLLEAEPKNGDALRGLAAVAIRQGDAATAGDWYLKALEADPKDASAQAGLIGLRGHGGEPGDPLALESRLKSLIAAQPEVGALHFALGNIFAHQNRWSEAQQAFFKAFSAEPEHPDYAFNLAVSLDHLRQGRLAAQYYNQALALAAQRPSGFDKVQVATRLREIQP